MLRSTLALAAAAVLTVGLAAAPAEAAKKPKPPKVTESSCTQQGGVYSESKGTATCTTTTTTTTYGAPNADQKCAYARYSNTDTKVLVREFSECYVATTTTTTTTTTTSKGKTTSTSSQTSDTNYQVLYYAGEATWVCKSLSDGSVLPLTDCDGMPRDETVPPGVWLYPLPDDAVIV